MPQAPSKPDRTEEARAERKWHPSKEQSKKKSYHSRSDSHSKSRSEPSGHPVDSYQHYTQEEDDEWVEKEPVEEEFPLAPSLNHDESTGLRQDHQEKPPLQGDSWMVSHGSFDAILQRLQDASASTFSCFLLLHLASPIAAALSSTSNCESAASNLQLATRVFYQDGRSRELLLVWIPLGTHILVGIVRRITRINRRRRIRARLELSARLAEPIPSSGPATLWTPRPPSTREWLMSYLPNTWHAIAGYAGIPFLLDHIFHHRLTAPPSLRSFQFVGFVLHESPISNYVKYIAIVSTLVYHSFVGLDQIQSRYLTGRKDRENQYNTAAVSRSQRSIPIRLAWLGVVGTVGLGIRKLARHEIPPWIARRYV